MSKTLYGITQCDTVRKARAWLEVHAVCHVFHDYKKAGIERATLESWVAQKGWETILNRVGTTFRKLPDSQKQDLDAGSAIDLMLAQPSMIKRPIFEEDGRLVVGFKPDAYAAAFGKR